MVSQSTIQILNKDNYTDHRLVTIPSTPSDLGPSSLRIQSKVLGLTTNNLTYARMGSFMGWWTIYRQPENTPAPYNDKSTYIRTPAWGFAEILESTVPEIPAGKTLYGFLPIGTDPIDLQVELPSDLSNQIVVLNEHRKDMWKIYNRYRILPPLEDYIKEKTLDIVGWDPLMWGLFATGYNTSRHAFAWDDERRCFPSGPGKGEWSADDANLDDSAVICLSASGKTAMAFAYCLRQERPKEHQPKLIIGVGSSASKSLTQNSGFYDNIFLYEDFKAVQDFVMKEKVRRVVLVDFGAREGFNKAWRDTFESPEATLPFQFVAVGGGVKATTEEETGKWLAELGHRIVVNASDLREVGIENGGDAYMDELDTAFTKFKEGGGVPGCQLKWQEGMEAWDKSWDDLCKDKVGPDTGLVFRL
ncbi:hypothetical protein BDV96DRAFT_639960 [Lophiotrema nucula]|uniref:Uncharacterized protein n=1 Tax=Lophiotrema nucula TaxID=690887 RepID=A0A6A5ZQY5_9PLEO|nr:hypothetical protein BDV96DRAFT_639960 [Lophiotrema nucula]